jgi:hypothetical protein
MNNLFTWIKNNPIRSMFLIPIFLVAGISISHVVAWYDITNPYSWAIYLSIAIEIGAITALIAATQRIKGGVWFMFGLVTFVQMVGNIFYSYKEIDPTGELFTSWVELTSPIFELFGTEPTDIISHKRWLAILGGGLLPVISLTSLHFFVKYEEPEKPTTNDTQIDKDLEIVSLMDLETILEKEKEEKPKVKKGRKKKEVVESPIEEKVEITTEELPTIDSKIESEEVETEVQPHLNPQDFGLELESEIQKEEIPVIPTRPTKLTYTKPNMSIDRL